MADQNSLERATKLKAKNNLKNLEGTTESTLFESFNNFDNIAMKVNSVGICLGTKDDHVTSHVNFLKSQVVKSVGLSETLYSENEEAGCGEDLDLASDYDLIDVNLLCDELLDGFSEGECDQPGDRNAPTHINGPKVPRGRAKIKKHTLLK